MVSFAVTLPPGPAVDKWVRKNREQLRQPSHTQPLQGNVTQYADGLTVYEITPTLPRFIANYGVISLAIGAGAAIIFDHYALAKALVITGGIISIVWNAWWTPVIYKAIIQIQTYRLTKKWLHGPQVHAEQEALRRLAHGQI